MSAAAVDLSGASAASLSTSARDTMRVLPRGRAALHDPVDQAPPADAGEWERLMDAALAGDQAAYTRLLREMLAWLRGFYARRLPAAAADDAAQEALIALHHKRHTYQPGRPLRPWVAAIARYKWIDGLRNARAHVALDEEALPAEDASGAIDGAMTLHTLLAGLKPAQAEVIRLVKLRGYSVAEASRMTGQSESLVKINIHRGIARLARQVEQDDRTGRAKDAASGDA
jgi:RNA polymerase sigma factor (sigma-70 family)